MDVTLLSENSIRLKSKNGSIIVNPILRAGKIEANAVIKLENYPDYDDSKIEGSKITIKNTGEYEINGIKVSALSLGEKLLAQVDLDGVRVILVNGSSLDKIQDKAQGGAVVVLNADRESDYSILNAMDPNVILIYGNKKTEAKKSLGKENAETVSKYSVTQEKLPEELQVFVLE